MNQWIFVFISLMCWMGHCQETEMGDDKDESGDREFPSSGNNRIVVADAVFGAASPYKGIVRFTQKVNQMDSGEFFTKVEVNLKRDDGTVTEKHMWHVELNPVETDSVCDAENPHFNPYGFEKSWDNYTTYCSNVNPDFCYMGDLSSKSALVSVGGPQTYTAKLVPLVGPNSIIGHSLNIHKENMIGDRIACTDIKLNKRLTTWTKIIKIPIKTPAEFPFTMVEVRSAVAGKLGLPIQAVQVAQRLDKISLNSCQTISFMITDAISPGKWKFVDSLKFGEVPLGKMSPTGCTIDKTGRASSAATRHSYMAITLISLVTTFFI